MKILAMETSAKQFSIALLDTAKVVHAETSNEFNQSDKGIGTGRSSSMLVPMIKSALKMSGWGIGDVELIALTIGPGSFTGLRVGVVTAKALSYVNQTPMIGLSTLEVIAAATAAETDPTDFQTTNRVFSIATNAQRQQLFCGRFKLLGPWQVEQMGNTTIENRASWLERLSDDAVVSGSGIPPILESLQQIQDERGFKIAPQSCWCPTAESVGHVGRTYFEAGRRDDPWAMFPEYFRPSAAEEKANRSKNPA